MTTPRFLKQLGVFGFRGVRRELSIQFGRRLTIISGGNATGKSSIVQAIQYALTGEIVDHYNRPIRSDNLRHLSTPTAGQVRLGLAGVDFEDAGELSASTSETRAQIRNRAAAKLVRDWTGTGDPPFTITHLTSQELLAELLSPDTRLSKNNVASLFSDSHLRLMTRRAEVLAEHCRRLAFGDNTRAALMKLTDRLESAKVLRDGLAATVSPVPTRRDIDAEIAALARGLSVIADRATLQPLRSAIDALEDRARKRMNDIRFVASIVAGLVAAETERASAKQTCEALELEEQQLRKGAELMAATVRELRQRERVVGDSLQEARRIVDRGAAFEGWSARLRSLESSLDEAKKVAAELRSRVSVAEGERGVSQSALAAHLEQLARVDEKRGTTAHQLSVVAACLQLPIESTREELRVLRERLVSLREESEALGASIAEARAAADRAATTFDSARGTLDAAAAASLRMKSAIDALLEVPPDSQCPLCGHDHGSGVALRSAIEHVRETRARLLSAAQMAADSAKEQLDRARSQLNELLARWERVRADTDAVGHRETSLVSTIDALESRRRRMLAEAGLREDLTELALEDYLADLQAAAERLATESTEIGTLRDQAQAIDLEHASRVTALRAQLQQSIRAEEQVAATLEEHRRARPDEVDVQAVTQAQRQVREATAELHALQNHLAVRASQHRDAEVRADALKARLSGALEIVGQLDQRIAHATASIREHGIDDVSAAGLASEESKAAAALAQATAYRDQLSGIESHLTSLEAASRLQAASDEVARATQALTSQQAVASQFEGLEKQFRALHVELLQRQSTLAESMLAATAEPCALLFHAMTAGCPWPLVFRLEDDRIVARLGTRDDAARADNILNAAYFNVAAVALRLALGAHQTWSHLRTAIFDDPILEMDNLTQAALIDGLESVLTSADSRWASLQLVITTWSDEFALMASHKLAHLNDDGIDNFVVYQLESDPSGTPGAARFTPHWTRKTSAA